MKFEKMNFDMTFEELKKLVRSEYGEFIEDSCYDSPESLLKALEDLSEHVDCSPQQPVKQFRILFKFDGKLSRKKHINNFYYIVLKLNMSLKHVFQT